MTEILNLISICRCCHQDGQFKSLQAPYLCDGHVDVYANIIYDTFGIAIKYPPIEASFSICDECISQLKQASYFKKQVLACELKFENYCKNELTGVVKVETDDEGDDTQSNDYGLDCMDLDNDNVPVEPIDHQQIEVKLESEAQSEKNDICKRTLRTRKPTNNKRIRKATTVNKATVNKINKTIVKKDVKLEESKPEVAQKHFQCKKCDLKCENRGELRKHIKETHKSNQTFECDMCDGISFALHCQFIEHMKSHNIDRPFLCHYCKKGYTTFHAMQYHINSQHEKKQVFQCDFCGKNFYSKSIIIKHLRLHYGTSKRFVCDICGMRFNDRTNLKIHIRAVHENIKAYSCNFCEKAFKTIRPLKVHIRHHTGERPFGCELCGKNFVSSDHLKSHKKRKHSDTIKIKPKVFNCLVCQKEVYSRSTYIRHLMMHRGNLPYKCTLCSKDFTNKYTLNRHIETHSDAQFECDLCMKKFTTKTVLKRHKDTVHNKDPKTIGCKKCNRFVRKIDKHKCVTEKLQCHLCDKVYASKGLLNRHIRIKHLGIWKHVCSVCGKKYTKIEGLRRHTKKIHSTKSKTDSLWIPIEDNIENDVLAHTISKVEIEED